MIRAAALALALAAAPASAQEPPTVTTHGLARDRLPNTVADASIAIEARGRTGAEVQAALAAGSGPLLAWLGTTGAERIRSQGPTLRAELDPTRTGAARVVGYTGRLGVTFTLEAAKLGPVLTEALNRGANTIEGAALRPREAELDGARNRLAAAATVIALDQARAVAEAAGLRAGPVRALVVDPSQPVFRPMMARANTAAAAPIETEAGDTEVTATVTATVALVQP